MRAKQAGHVAYLLRLWRAHGLQGETWRASLEDAATHEIRGFRSLEALMMFLKEVKEGMPNREPG
jgi:hypothetical protein